MLQGRAMRANPSLVSGRETAADVAGERQAEQLCSDVASQRR